MSSSSAAIVANQVEAFESKMPHQADLVICHSAKGIIRMVGQACRLGGGAIASQICADDGEALGKPWRNSGPHGHRLRKAVQEQHWRPVTSDDAGDVNAGYRDDFVFEAFKHCRPLVLAET